MILGNNTQRAPAPIGEYLLLQGSQELYRILMWPALEGTGGGPATECRDESPAELTGMHIDLRACGNCLKGPAYGVHFCIHIHLPTYRYLGRCGAPIFPRYPVSGVQMR